MRRLLIAVFLFAACNCSHLPPPPAAEAPPPTPPRAAPPLVLTSDTFPASRGPSRPWTDEEIAGYAAQCMARMSQAEILPALARIYCDCRTDRISRLFSASWLQSPEPPSAEDNRNVAAIDRECRDVVLGTL